MPSGRKVVLHVGTPKTGTTYLQDVLWRNRRVLRQRGVHYPGDRPQSHFLAAMDLQGATAVEVGDPDVPGAWSRLAAAVRAGEGTSVVSHELFAPMAPDRVERAHRELAGAELHVVCTVRDLARQLPAVWQEDLKNRHSLTFGEFVESVRAPAGQGHWLGALFWAMQDPVDILRRWAVDVPPERVHIVTVPPRGAPPHLLWQRFASVLGVDPECAESGSRTPNSSLGPAEAHLLRLLNQSLDPDLPWVGYEAAVRSRLVDRLAMRPGDVARLSVPARDGDWLTERSERTITELRDAGYHIVGDLDELRPAPVPDCSHPDDVDPREVLDAAVEALRTVLEREARAVVSPHERRAAGLRRRLRALSERHETLMRARLAFQAARRARAQKPARKPAQKPAQ